MKSQKGFNLIELLVVIAIIGILSTIALASLNSARSKAADKTIIAELVSVREQASLYYDSNGYTYGSSVSDCNTGVFSDPTIQNIISKIKEQNGNVNLSCTTNPNGQSLAISSPLRSGGVYCVADSGINGSKWAAGGVCPQ